MLVDGPCKFLVELPGNKGKYDGENAHEDRQCNQHGLQLSPHVHVEDDESLTHERVDSVPKLVKLDARIEQDARVVQDDANDLNCVLHAQRIVDQNQLVDVSEHKHGEVRRDRSHLGYFIGNVFAQAILKSAKNISLSCQRFMFAQQ